jgi:hypothetical protein
MEIQSEIKYTKAEKEAAAHKAQVDEYLKAILQPQDIIGLMGHQPSLRKIREAWHAGELTEEDLMIAVDYLATTLKGHPESFKDINEFVKLYWSDLVELAHNKERPKLSTDEQRDLIKRVLGDKKKRTVSKPKPQPKAEPIDSSKLPPHLRHLA